MYNSLLVCICGGNGDVYIDNVCVRAFQGIVQRMIPCPAAISDNISIRSYTIVIQRSAKVGGSLPSYVCWLPLTFSNCW